MQNFGSFKIKLKFKIQKSKMKIKIKTSFSKVYPILFIVIAWFIFASPYFLKNKVPFASTYQVNFFAPWSAYSKFWGPVKNNAMPDVITQIYPWKHFTIETLKSGQIPLWNPYSFSGTPHLANYQSAVLSPFNFLFFLPAGGQSTLSFIDAWSILILLQPLLAGLFMYLLIRALNFTRLISLTSSFSFMFCGFITVWMGYGTLGYAILFLPLGIYAIEKFCQVRKIKFLVLLSFTIPLSFFSGHFQISAYFLAVIILFAIYKSIVNKNVFNFLYLMLYIFFGILLSLPQLLPSIELYSKTLRSSLFQLQEAIPWQYFITFIAPDFFGNPVTRNDWFGHYAEWNGYIGVLPLILAIYGLTNKKKAQTYFLFISGILVLFLAFNTPLLTFLINLHIPVLSTSAASRIIVIYSFLFIFLSAFGFEQLLIDIKNRKVKKLIIWTSFFSLIYIIIWLIVFFGLFIPADWQIVARQNLILPTFIFLISIICIFLALFFAKRKKFEKYIYVILPLILMVVVAFDMLRFAIKWQPFDPKNLVYAEVPTTQKFKKLKGYERALGNLGGEALVYYGIPSVEGYDAVYIKRYGEFVSFINQGTTKKIERSVVSFAKKGKYTSKAINLLGIKYIIHKISDDNTVWTFPYWEYSKDQFKLIYDDSRYKIFENKNVFPRAFWVGKYRVAKDDQEILKTMFSESFNLRNEIILEKNPNIQQFENEIGEAEITIYTPNRIKILINAEKNGLLFLSDVYYKDWEAFIDGRKSEVYRADYIFRAVSVPGGKHVVEFVYNPLSFKMGLYSFLTGLILITGASFIFTKKKIFALVPKI